MKALKLALLILLLAFRGASAGEAALSPSNPFIVGDAIYLAADGLMKYDRQTLSLRWRALGGMELSDPVVSGSLVFAGGSSGLFALSAESGEVVWKRPEAGWAFAPVVVGDTVFVANEKGSLQALSAMSGELRWTRRFDGWVYPPALAGDTLVVTGRERVLYGLEPGTGAVRWSDALPQEPVYGPRSVKGGYAVVNTFDGSVRMVGGGDGEIAWEIADGIASQAPVAHDGKLYFPGYDGVLRVRSALDGKLLWQRRAHGALTLPPAVADGLVIVASRDGEIVALDAGSGEPRWSRSSREELLAGPRLATGRLLLFTPNASAGSEAGPPLFLALQTFQQPTLQTSRQPKEYQ